MPLTKTGNLIFESNIVKRPIKVRPSINIGGPENLAYNKAYNRLKLLKNISKATTLGLLGYGAYRTVKNLKDTKKKMAITKEAQVFIDRVKTANINAVDVAGSIGLNALGALINEGLEHVVAKGYNRVFDKEHYDKHKDESFVEERKNFAKRHPIYTGIKGAHRLANTISSVPLLAAMRKGH